MSLVVAQKAHYRRSQQKDACSAPMVVATGCSAFAGHDKSGQISPYRSIWSKAVTSGALESFINPP